MSWAINAQLPSFHLLLAVIQTFLPYLFVHIGSFQCKNHHDKEWRIPFGALASEMIGQRILLLY